MINVNDIKTPTSDNYLYRYVGHYKPPKRVWLFVKLNGKNPLMIARRVGWFRQKWLFDDSSKLPISALDQWSYIPTMAEMNEKQK